MRNSIATVFSFCSTFGIIAGNCSTKHPDNFRDYENNYAPSAIEEFYRLNHIHQTLDFVLSKKKEFCSLNKMKMGIWQAMKELDTIIDESDPDLSKAQTIHAIQTAEQLKKDGHPRWLILTGLIHDLGKVLILFGEAQWAVVGDTFPVGCAYSDKIVFSSYFKNNPDMQKTLLQTQCGIYEPHCGLDRVHMSWGHDEYLFHVVKNHLPEEALYIIRYHSFYAAHKDNEYEYLMNDYDKKMMQWVKLFNQYDLYSKSNEPFEIEKLLAYYQELVEEFFPDELAW